MILHLYTQFGPGCIKLLDGMFALAIVTDDELLLARDPLGIKSLYIGAKDDALYFASEIKALTQVTDDIREFPAGYWYSSRSGWQRYYRLEKTFRQETPITTSSETLPLIREVLRRAVHKRLMTSIPVGVSLSGGLDSGIVSLLAMEGQVRLHSFAVGVEDSPDLAAAQVMARFLGTQHHQFVYTAQDVLAALPDIIYYLESFDPGMVRNAIPNYFLARLATEHVKVLLTGEGADELYAGNTYLARFEQPQALQAELIAATSALHNTSLQRLDRMAMAYGLEGRVPFLDVESVALALGLPPLWKLHRAGRPEKELLRRAFADSLPAEILNRPKQKFAEGAGSAGIVASLAEETISEAEFAAEGQRLAADWDYTFFSRLYRGQTESPQTLLEWVGLGEDGRMPVSQYSKGMKNRLSVARALLHRPELLFLDEPTSGLDPVNARRVKELVKAQKEAGRTVFLTTHDMTVADELCDRVAFIVDGQIKLIDRPRELKLRYGQPRVRIKYQGQSGIASQEFPLSGLGGNSEFLRLLQTDQVQTLHSLEASLEEVFIRVTGRELL